MNIHYDIGEDVMITNVGRRYTTFTTWEGYLPCNQLFDREPDTADVYTVISKAPHNIDRFTMLVGLTSKRLNQIGLMVIMNVEGIKTVDCKKLTMQKAYDELNS